MKVSKKRCFSVNGKNYLVQERGLCGECRHSKDASDPSVGIFEEYECRHPRFGEVASGANIAETLKALEKEGCPGTEDYLESLGLDAEHKCPWWEGMELGYCERHGDFFKESGCAWCWEELELEEGR